MAQRVHKLNLQRADFPLLSRQQGRAVIGATSEEIYDKGSKSGLYYCHNVMPTLKGLDSVAYKLAVQPAQGLNLQDVREIYSSVRSRHYIAWNNKREAFILSASLLWVKLVSTIPSTATEVYDKNTITLATANGVTYLFFEGLGAFTFDSGTDQLVPVVFTGLSEVIGLYLGLVGSSGYLIAYTTKAIVWSSTIDPTDFTPSEVTGAGGANISDIGGSIKFALHNPLGFLLYTDTNVVAGTFTSNPRYPFKFKEVDNSKGGVDLDLIAYDSNAAAHFVYTKAGLQTITSQRATSILPEVTDFLGGKLFEDYDETTGKLTEINLSGYMIKKLKYIAARYLVISYGVSSFTHALVYDLVLERLGKLKIAHTDCFEYVSTDSSNDFRDAKDSLGLLLPDGSIRLVDFSLASASLGVAMFGKIRHSRTRLISLLSVELEYIEDDADLMVSDLVSLDGYDGAELVTTAINSAQGVRKYVLRATGINHTIKLVGQFNLTTLLITYLATGKR